MELKPERISINGKDYEVIITKKYMRSMSMRFSKDGKSILVHAPYFVPKFQVMRFVEERGLSLVKRAERKTKTLSNQNVLFGEPVALYPNEETIKALLLEYCLLRQREYEKIMDIPAYRVKVKNVTSYYGINSQKTNTITYSTVLAHYSKEIIDSVIVHELAHHFERNHQKAFYDIVYRYSPNYKELHKKLKEGICQ